MAWNAVAAFKSWPRLTRSALKTDFCASISENPRSALERTQNLKPETLSIFLAKTKRSLGLPSFSSTSPSRIGERRSPDMASPWSMTNSMREPFSSMSHCRRSVSMLKTGSSAKSPPNSPRSGLVWSRTGSSPPTVVSHSERANSDLLGPVAFTVCVRAPPTVRMRSV